MTPPPTLQELIDTVRQDAPTDDPVTLLEVAAQAAADLEATTDALVGHFVDRCRQQGRSWSEISQALGVTRQAVHKRFAGPIAARLAASPGQPTFEHFTQRARSVIAAAAAQARASGHLEVGTGHLLLGLYAEPDGLAARALAAMQVSQETVQAALQEAWTRAAGPRDEPVAPPDASGDPPAGRPPMAPGARTVLLNAVAVALERGHNYIGTEHILLALYSDPDSLAARVLAAAGASSQEAGVRITEMLRTGRG